MGISWCFVQRNVGSISFQQWKVLIEYFVLGFWKRAYAYLLLRKKWTWKRLAVRPWSELWVQKCRRGDKSVSCKNLALLYCTCNVWLSYNYNSRVICQWVRVKRLHACLPVQYLSVVPHMRYGQSCEHICWLGGLVKTTVVGTAMTSCYSRC